jgi:hypothetical protein
VGNGVCQVELNDISHKATKEHKALAGNWNFFVGFVALWETVTKLKLYKKINSNK